MCCQGLFRGRGSTQHGPPGVVHAAGGRLGHLPIGLALGNELPSTSCCTPRPTRLLRAGAVGSTLTPSGSQHGPSLGNPWDLGCVTPRPLATAGNPIQEATDQAAPSCQEPSAKPHAGMVEMLRS